MADYLKLFVLQADYVFKSLNISFMLYQNYFFEDSLVFMLIS